MHIGLQFLWLAVCRKPGKIYPVLYDAEVQIFNAECLADQRTLRLKDSGEVSDLHLGKRDLNGNAVRLAFFRLNFGFGCFLALEALDRKSVV